MKFKSTSKAGPHPMRGIGFLIFCVIVWATACGAQEEPKKSGFFSRIMELVKKKEEPPPPPALETKPATAEPSPPKPKAGATTAKPRTTVSTTAKKPLPKTAAKEQPKESKTAASKGTASDQPKPEAPKDKPAVTKSEPEVTNTPAGSQPEPDGKPASESATNSTKPEGKSGQPIPPQQAPKSDGKPLADSKSVATAGSSRKTNDDAKSTAIDHKEGEFGKGDEKPMDVTTTSKVDTTTTSPAAQLKEPSHPSVPAYPLPPSRNVGWQLVKMHGRDYVGAENIQQFYRFASLKIERSHVWLKSPNLILKAQMGSQDMLINNVKFILSYPVEEWNGKAMFSRLDLCKLIEPILRPSYITGAEPFDTVVLDAGHGGHDSGARGVYGYEKDFALQMARTVRTALQRRGFKVIMTRDSDAFISRTGRVAIANKTPNSIFISLHFNSGGSAASGIETFALTPQGSAASLDRGGGMNYSKLTGNQQDSENIALATAVHGMVMYRLYTLVDRGIKRAQWTVLTGCNRPGILFEGGFVTNSQECRLIASTKYRDALANAIGDAVLNYRKALQPTLNSPVRR